MEIKMFEDYEDILTTEELAQILRLNERTVIKLAKEGQLPAAKIASQFRFSKEKILEWLDLQMDKYSDDLLSDMEKGILNKAIPIHSLLKPVHIKMDMQAQTKEEALKELVDLAAGTGLVKNPEELLKCVKAREELCSTAVENHIAFPHPRATSWTLVKNWLIVIGISKKGIEFGAADDKPVKIFVMMSIPLLPLHLQLLSRLARIFKDDSIKQKIYDAKNQEEVIAIIEKKESILQQIL